MAASCFVYKWAKAVQSIMVMTAELCRVYGNAAVECLDWITKYKYDEMSLRLTIPGPDTAAQLVKLLNLTVAWKATWLLNIGYETRSVSVTVNLPTLLKGIDKNNTECLYHGMKDHIAMPQCASPLFFFAPTWGDSFVVLLQHAHC